MHHIYETDQAPLPIGAYAQAIEAGNMIFLSGQIPISPHTGELAGTDLVSQTIQVFKNLDAILTEVGCTVSQVVKTTVFLTDLGGYADFNRLYADWVGTHTPARSVVQVSALPKDALVEIELIILKETIS